MKRHIKQIEKELDNCFEQFINHESSEVRRSVRQVLKEELELDSEDITSILFQLAGLVTVSLYEEKLTKRHENGSKKKLKCEDDDDSLSELRDCRPFRDKQRDDLISYCQLAVSDNQDLSLSKLENHFPNVYINGFREDIEDFIPVTSNSASKRKKSSSPVDTTNDERDWFKNTLRSFVVKRDLKRGFLHLNNGQAFNVESLARAFEQCGLNIPDRKVLEMMLIDVNNGSDFETIYQFIKRHQGV